MLRQVTSRIIGRQLSPAGPPPRLYHERVVDHYDNPRNVGTFDKNDADVGTGLVGAPACGDVMKLQIKVDQESGKIVDACFKTFGCGSAIASSSVGTRFQFSKFVAYQLQFLLCCFSPLIWVNFGMVSFEGCH